MTDTSLPLEGKRTEWVLNGLVKYREPHLYKTHFKVDSQVCFEQVFYRIIHVGSVQSGVQRITMEVWNDTQHIP